MIHAAWIKHHNSWSPDSYSWSRSRNSEHALRLHNRLDSQMGILMSLKIIFWAINFWWTIKNRYERLIDVPRNQLLHLIRYKNKFILKCNSNYSNVYFSNFTLVRLNSGIKNQLNFLMLAFFLGEYSFCGSSFDVASAHTILTPVKSYF